MDGGLSLISNGRLEAEYSEAIETMLESHRK